MTELENLDWNIESVSSQMKNFNHFCSIMGLNAAQVAFPKGIENTLNRLKDEKLKLLRKQKLEKLSK